MLALVRVTLRCSGMAKGYYATSSRTSGAWSVSFDFVYPSRSSSAVAAMPLVPSNVSSAPVAIGVG
jgi:hypothetical protein